MKKSIKYILIIFLLFQYHSTLGATITKSIKASDGDYTTPALWEADLDNTTPYDAGDDAVGELYDESYLVTSVLTIDGGGTIGLNSVKLSVASTERSSGTAGTGARITVNGAISNGVISLVPLAGSDKLTLEYFEINGNGQALNVFIFNGNAGSGRAGILRYLMLHDGSTSIANNYFVRAEDRDIQVQNSIFYDFVATNNRTIIGLRIDCGLAGGGIFNNIVDNITSHGTGSSTAYQIQKNDADCRLKNNIGTRTNNVPLDFYFPVGFSLITSSNNLSDDATADDGGGSNHVVSATFANMFVSTTAGSEDYSPQSVSAPQVDLGVDLVTTPTGVNFDFKGRDRDVAGDTWDIGAIEFVSVGVGTARVIRLHGVRLYGLRLR